MRKLSFDYLLLKHVKYVFRINTLCSFVIALMGVAELALGNQHQEVIKAG